LCTNLVRFFEVLSLDTPLLVIVGVFIGWVFFKLFRVLRTWRSTMKQLLEEKEREILELQSLWKVNPSTIEWERLLSR